MAAPINVCDLTKMLQCGICKNTLSNPKSLRCSHSFCKLCLDGLIEFIEGGSGVLKCPRDECEKCSFISSDQTTNDLHVDFIVKGVVDMVKVSPEQAENAMKYKCNACDKDIKKYCIHCKVYLCELCRDSHDNIKDAFVPVQFHSQENKLKIYCKEHATEAHYTCSCGKDEFICVYCIHRTHKNHNYETFLNAERTLKGMLVNKISFSEDLDLQWGEAKEDMSTARSYLTEILMINKINCINDYVDFVNKEEEKLKYDFDLLTSYHTKSFSTTVDSIEYFKECMSKEAMDILLERSEIMTKLNSTGKSRKIPEVTVSLTDPCFNEQNPLGLMSIRIYGKRFFVDGNRKTFKSDLPAPNVRDPSLKTLECLLRDVLYMPAKEINSESTKNGQSSSDKQSENIVMIDDGAVVMTDTQAKVVESVGDEVEGDVEIEGTEGAIGTDLERAYIETEGPREIDLGVDVIDLIDDDDDDDDDDETEGITGIDDQVGVAEGIEVKVESDVEIGGQIEDIERVDDETDGATEIDDQVEDIERVNDETDGAAEIDDKVDGIEGANDETEGAAEIDCEVDGIEGVNDETEGDTEIYVQVDVIEMIDRDRQTEAEESETETEIETETEEDQANGYIEIDDHIEGNESEGNESEGNESEDEGEGSAGIQNQIEAVVSINKEVESDINIEDHSECIEDKEEIAVKCEAECEGDSADMEAERVARVEEKTEVGIVKFVVEHVSKIRNTVLSDAVMIQNLPWRIMLMPQYSENDGGKIVRNAGIFVQCDPEQEGSSWLCQAHGKITLKNHKYDEISKKITDGIFTNEHSCWGHSSFISWVDIMDVRKGFNRDDVIIIEAVVEVEPPLFFKAARVYSNPPSNERDAVATKKRKLSDHNNELLSLLMCHKKEKKEECDYSQLNVDRGFR